MNAGEADLRPARPGGALPDRAHERAGPGDCRRSATSTRTRSTKRRRATEAQPRRTAPAARAAGRHPGAGQRLDRRDRHGHERRSRSRWRTTCRRVTRRSSRSSRRRARSSSVTPTRPSWAACSIRTCRRATRRLAGRCCCPPTPTSRSAAPRRARLLRSRPVSRRWRSASETSTDSAQLIAPAGNAGVVGLKPTVGLVGRTGTMPVATSQDAPGPIGQTVSDVALALEALAGPDPSDPATAGQPSPLPSYTAGLSPTALSGKKIAVVSSTTVPYPAAVDRARDARGDNRRRSRPGRRRRAERDPVRVPPRPRLVPASDERAEIAAGSDRIQQRQPGRGPEVRAGQPARRARPSTTPNPATTSDLRSQPRHRQGRRAGR